MIYFVDISNWYNLRITVWIDYNVNISTDYMEEFAVRYTEVRHPPCMCVCAVQCGESLYVAPVVAAA